MEYTPVQGRHLLVILKLRSPARGCFGGRALDINGYKRKILRRRHRCLQRV